MNNIDVLEQSFKKLCQAYYLYRFSIPPVLESGSTAYITVTPIKLDGIYYEAFDFIPRTKGCWWHNTAGGCFMCSFSVGTNSPTISASDINRQFDEIFDDLDNQSVISIFPCSTLDPIEFPDVTRSYISSKLRSLSNLRYVMLEATAENINKEVLFEIKEMLPSVSIVIHLGVETSNDFIRRYCIHKSFTWKKVIQAIDIIHRFGMQAHALLLLKPPFLLEDEAVADCLQSIQDCVIAGFDGIGLRGVEVANCSITELLFSLNLYSSFSSSSILTVMSKMDPKYIQKTTITSFTRSQLSSEKISSIEDENIVEYVQQTVNAFNKQNIQIIEAEIDEIKPIDLKIIEPRLLKQYDSVYNELLKRITSLGNLPSWKKI